jgi:oxygen-dependent protoporphyrinogen oxidase
MRRKIVIIGGGISGLAAAHRIVQDAPGVDVLVLEAGKRLGGVLHTVNSGGFLVEEAADNFLTVPGAATELCRHIGLDNALISPSSGARRAFVLNHGNVRPLPAGFQPMGPGRLWPMLHSPILSARGKLRMALEVLSRARQREDDESLANFARRHFGPEALERLIQPLVGSIYTADVEQLSIEAALPSFRRMEREHGSLIRALYAQRKTRKKSFSTGARYEHFAAPREGMSSLVDKLAERLPRDAVALKAPVERLILLDDGKWQVLIGGERRRLAPADAVILATPSYETAKIVNSLDPKLADQLAEIEYAGCAIACLGYHRDQIKHPLDGAGLVIPLVEERLILSCSFTSQKYAGRAPEDSVLLRVFMGGACQSGLLRLDSELLLELAEAEVSEFLGIQGEPSLRRLIRHRRAMPQYHVGHCGRVAEIERRVRRFPNLELAGSAYSGVGVPACINSGQQAANSILQRLKAAAPALTPKRELHHV